MMTMEAELRSLREELSHRSGSGSGRPGGTSSASSLESERQKSAIVGKKKLAVAKERQLSIDSLDNAVKATEAVKSDMSKPVKLGSNGEVSTGSEEDSDPGDSLGHLMGTEKRLSLLREEDDMPKSALSNCQEKLSRSLENTDGNAEIDEDDEDVTLTDSKCDIKADTSDSLDSNKPDSEAKTVKSDSGSIAKTVKEAPPAIKSEVKSEDTTN